MPRWLKYTIFGSILLLAASFPLARQLDFRDRQTGAIGGRITSDGRPVAEASIETRNLMSGTIVRTNSEADGRYLVEDLEPGRYSMWVRKADYNAVWIPRIIVNPGAIATRDVALKRSGDVRSPAPLTSAPE